MLKIFIYLDQSFCTKSNEARLSYASLTCERTTPSQYDANDGWPQKHYRKHQQTGHFGEGMMAQQCGRMIGGAIGLKELFAKMRPRWLGRWYAGLLIPPALILLVLLFLKTCVSPIYAPNRFFIGISFGVLAGFLEEIGWMGFAFPALSKQRSALSAAVLLGLIWGFWHLPVINFLGTAWPHGAYLVRYFLAFIAAMTAMRVLIAWLYTNTKSVFLAQLMHISSTGSLVAFSPPFVTARQEALWYSLYAGILWLFVALVVLKTGIHLKGRAATEISEMSQLS